MTITVVYYSTMHTFSVVSGKGINGDYGHNRHLYSFEHFVYPYLIFVIDYGCEMNCRLYVTYKRRLENLYLYSNNINYVLIDNNFKTIV